MQRRARPIAPNEGPGRAGGGGSVLCGGADVRERPFERGTLVLQLVDPIVGSTEYNVLRRTVGILVPDQRGRIARRLRAKRSGEVVGLPRPVRLIRPQFVQVAVDAPVDHMQVRFRGVLFPAVAHRITGRLNEPLRFAQVSPGPRRVAGRRIREIGRAADTPTADRYRHFSRETPPPGYTADSRAPLIPQENQKGAPCASSGWQPGTLGLYSTASLERLIQPQTPVGDVRTAL